MGPVKVIWDKYQTQLSEFVMLASLGTGHLELWVGAEHLSLSQDAHQDMPLECEGIPRFTMFSGDRAAPSPNDGASFLSGSHKMADTPLRQPRKE